MTAPAPTTTRRALAILAALASAALLAGCGGGPDPPQRAASGEITKAGIVRLLKLREGDCVRDLEYDLDHDDGGHNGVPEVNAVPCSQPHKGEILQITSLENEQGQDWPGEAIVGGDAAGGRIALQERLNAVRRERGADVLGRFTVFTYEPTRQRWLFEGQHAALYLAFFDSPRRGRIEMRPPTP